MAYITFTHPTINSGTAVTVLARALNFNVGVTNIKKPEVNLTGPTEVHSQTVENYGMSLTGVKYTGASNTLQVTDVQQLTRIRNDGSNHIVMNVVYGENTPLYILNNAGTAVTDIPVLLDGTQTLRFDTGDTDDAYLPIGDLKLIYTEPTS